jgi:hypothetical protein
MKPTGGMTRRSAWSLTTKRLPRPLQVKMKRVKKLL